MVMVMGCLAEIECKQTNFDLQMRSLTQFICKSGIIPIHGILVSVPVSDDIVMKISMRLYRVKFLNISF